MAPADAKFLRAVANHILLPPDLPGSIDRNLADINRDLLIRAQDACATLKATNKKEFQKELALLGSSLEHCQYLHISAHRDSHQLRRAFRELKPGEILIIYVNEQNAGLLVRHGAGRLEGKVVFEAFEVSAQSEKVLECASALQWSFPASSAAIPKEVFTDETFQQNLADFLERGSMETIKKFGAVTRKANSNAFEPRDTADPALITGLLIAILEGIGQSATVQTITKRVKDEVRWKNSLIPWRRSPFWLLLRVGVLRQLQEVTNPIVANTLYKALLCLIHSHLLSQVVGTQAPELSQLLLKKLCRRVAKMEKDAVIAPQSESDASKLQETILGNLRPLMFQATRDAKAALQNTWDNYKFRVQRRITSFNTRSARPEHLRLGLHTSGPYLQQLRQFPLRKELPAASFAMSPSMLQFLRRYTYLTEIEDSFLGRDAGQASSSCENWTSSALSLAEDIQSFLALSSDRNYEIGSVDRSRMVLTTMWLWYLMDQILCRHVPGFMLFKPAFDSDGLNCLLLSSYADLCQLHQIQTHLSQRHATANANGGHLTVFDVPVSRCLGDYSFQNSDVDSGMRQLNQAIQEAEERRKHEKEGEWAAKDARYQQIMREVAALNCQYNFVGDLLIPEHDDDCEKCSLIGKADKIAMERIEKAMPGDTAQSRSVLFELRCPPPFRVYRNATWDIVATLGLPTFHPTKKEAFNLVDDYYRKFSETQGLCQSKGGITLASRTKSFLQTHFRHAHFPIPLEKICVNNGLRFEYYDTGRKLWLSEYLRKTTFSHHCWVPIPRGSPFSRIEFPDGIEPGRSHRQQEQVSLPDNLSPSATYLVATSGILSNEILATLPRCPQALGVPEFVAFQGLFSESQRLWPAILAEMGSSNLNFSSEAVMILTQALANRTGRSTTHKSQAANLIFHDDNFCVALLSQIEDRLSSISSNWREHYCMEVLLTFLLKIISLGGDSVCGPAACLLETCRLITHEWIAMLREEFWRTIDKVALARLTHCMIWAALLCRRTYTIFSSGASASVQNLSISVTRSTLPCSEKALALPTVVIFLEASIALQENIVEDLGKLSPLLRSVLARDLKMAHRMQSCVRGALKKSPRALVTAAVKSAAVSSDALSSRPDITFAERPEGVWAKLCLPGKENFDSMTIEYHLVGGALLIDGRPVERELPPKIRHLGAISQLFPNQRLVVYPSSLPGMTYKLAFDPNGQEIHFGFRQGELVIRARSIAMQGGLWEYIPAGIFERNGRFDLPASMLDGCVHWLDMASNVIEVRRRPKIWRSARMNWKISLNNRLASRGACTLLDPGSNLFHHFASVFRGFEDPRHILVYQPPGYPLHVELRRYELTFFVNLRGFLQCLQLRAEVDDNQDAGTWYGLSSKIVLKSVQNESERSVIVPLGPLTVQRKGFHVDVQVQREDPVVGHFFLDDILGRVTCASEPRLFYTKALLHACTSFCLPDKLTGRTGADEACHILQMGSSQPYAPLTAVNTTILNKIADLTPKRQFYPADLHVMETITWAENLTVSVQDDRYGQLVSSIKQKSDLMAQFELMEEVSVQVGNLLISPETPVMESPNSQLALRGHTRRLTYDTPEFINGTANAGKNTDDLFYRCRGHHNFQKSQQSVREIAHLVYSWPEKVPSASLLHLMMEKWPVIEGYGDGLVIYDNLVLSHQLDIDIGSSWGRLVNLCRLSNEDTKYKVLFLLATASFRDEVDMPALRTLVAFVVLQELKTIDLPSWPIYTQFRTNFCPKPHYLKGLLRSCIKPFNLARQTLSTQRERKAAEAAARAHDVLAAQNLESLVEYMCTQWPCPRPDLQQFSTDTLDLQVALKLVAVEWHSMFQSYEFEEHLRLVQMILDKNRAAPPPRTCVRADNRRNAVTARGFPLAKLELLNKPGPPTNPQSFELGQNLSSGPAAKAQADNRDIDELRCIVAELPSSKSIVRNEYRDGLLNSIAALQKHRLGTDFRKPLVHLGQLDLLIANAKHHADLATGKLLRAVKQGEPGAVWLDIAGLWPFTTRVSILETLRTTSRIPMTPSMRAAIIDVGLAITMLQRLLRIQNACRREKLQQVNEEMQNAGHTNWKPENYPDWLLLEIDTNILIRPIQADVARQIATPASGFNSVLQLNMGQGKTSTIIPLVASMLANGKSLCRIVVPKALLLQTAQLLQSRLGGLLGRELRHIPFSRRTPSTCELTQAYRDIHKSVMDCSGVVIALPEHLMSFMLSGQQRLLDGKLEEGSKMIQVQRWLSRSSRDVFDESDFSMAVKTQLIYPSGPQVTVNGGSYRWEAIQLVLKLALSHLDVLERTHETSLQIVRREGGGFPFVYFLRPDVQHVLMRRIIGDICSGRASLLNMESFSSLERQAIAAFITQPSPERSVILCIAEIHKVNPPDGCVIYLLRGLFVHRVLILTLSRRWNVQYGLHPLRDPVAVPYWAKGVPSNLAEWGHVDVSLLFTCLSFYYQGLSLVQLRQSLERILKSDDPARGYEQWLQGSIGLSDRHRDWTSINLEDLSQMTEICNSARYNITAIDHFLNNFVFPKHAKQFKVKLQASGWDLPLSGSGKSLTTGFSGTNDSRLILPLTIKQDDMKGLVHTNAEVLSHLLQPRNRPYTLAGSRENLHGRAVYRRFSEVELLQKLRFFKIRVLIDAGALILEMTNSTLAKNWLDIDEGADAAVFFDDDNKATVLTRTGRKTPLLASPYAEDLSGCLVYLDEAHTRGTDLKFWSDARGAVTLSLGQTKDHTVQAVMRLRQLASTQSVTFFAPPEVHQSILDFRRKGDNEHLDSHDVICWLLEQTCQGLENLQPLYYAQGVNYCRRIQAEQDQPQFLSSPAQLQAYLETLQDHEQQSLKSLYEPRSSKKKRAKFEMCVGKAAVHIRELERRRKAFQDTGTAAHASALQEVEQEREVAVEAETIRERQKPVRFHPQRYCGLSNDLRNFVRNGVLSLDDRIWEPALSYMGRTATGLRYYADLPPSPRLLVTTEFRQAVIVPSGKVNDDFLRPVQWILWSTTAETAVLVSPEEAEDLFPLCRDAPKQLVHLLTYAAPVTQKMLQFNDLGYYAVPELPTNWSAPIWLKIQIGLFAGRLYFPYEELPQIREFLGLPQDEIAMAQDHLGLDLEDLQMASLAGSDDDSTSAKEEQQEVQDGEPEPQGQHQNLIEAQPNLPEEQTMTKEERAARLKATRMLTFLHAWLGTRSRGQDFTHTPMGYICARKSLTEDHPFFHAPEQRDEALRSRVQHAMAGDASMFADMDIGKEEDDHYDDEGVELDPRHKLTEEEEKMAREVDDEVLDEEDDEDADGEEDEDEFTESGV